MTAPAKGAKRKGKKPSSGPAPLTEEQKVLKWRREQFQKLGFDPAQATRLARAGADHHVVKKELDRGCSLPIATRIFS